MKRLVVNADDFGLHPGINAGVARAHAEGIVTSASLSPNGRAFDDAVRLARAHPGLDVGVHLTLVGEAPVSDPARLPTLAPDGRLPAYFTGLFARLLLGRVSLGEVERELSAQVARVVDAGVAVSHLDSHQHVHLHPAILPVTLAVARRFAVRGVRAAARIVPLRGLRSLLLAPFVARAHRRVRREALVTPDRVLGLSDTGRLDEGRLVRLLGALPEGASELVCHPGADTPAIAADYAWDFRWDEELHALTSPAAKEALAASGATLACYRTL